MINKYTHKCALSQGVLSMSERWQAQVFSEKASLEQRPGGGGGGKTWIWADEASSSLEQHVQRPRGRHSSISQNGTELMCLI